MDLTKRVGIFVGSALRTDLFPRYHLVNLVTLGYRQEFSRKRRPSMPPNRVSDAGYIVLLLQAFFHSPAVPIGSRTNSGWSVFFLMVAVVFPVKRWWYMGSSLPSVGSQEKLNAHILPRYTRGFRINNFSRLAAETRDMRPWGNRRILGGSRLQTSVVVKERYNHCPW